MARGENSRGLDIQEAYNILSTMSPIRWGVQLPSYRTQNKAFIIILTKTEGESILRPTSSRKLHFVWPEKSYLQLLSLRA